MMNTDGFADPWEQLRLLSDRPRNNLLMSLLARHAPGSIIAEVGAGTGLWSLAAAALGARHVFAIEPSPLHQTISALVQANGLSDKVTVVPAHVQEASPPRGGVDLAFSELLNVDPFAEEVLEAMDAAASWLSPSGRLAPGALTLHAALVSDAEPAAERRAALAAVRAVAQRTGLDLGPLMAQLRDPPPYCYAAPSVTVLGPPTQVFRIPLGQGVAPPPSVTVSLQASQAGIVGGVAVWFSADYGVGVMANPPEQPGHWGLHVSGWPRTQPVQAGEAIGVHVELEDGLVASPA